MSNIEKDQTLETDIPFYITKPQPCPYLPDRFERKIFTKLENGDSQKMAEYFGKIGFRRSQNITYRPSCGECNACISVRINVDEFMPTKAQRRIMKKNLDLSAKNLDPIASSEQYDLFLEYVSKRHIDGSMVDMSVLEYAQMVEQTKVNTILREYRKTNQVQGLESESFYSKKDKLLSVALTDIFSDGLSMIYSFFDICEGKRSLGNYMILDHVTLAKDLGLRYVYLGYWVKNSPKMQYKSQFKPLEGLTHKGWVELKE